MCILEERNGVVMEAYETSTATRENSVERSVGTLSCTGISGHISLLSLAAFWNSEGTSREMLGRGTLG